MQRIAFMFVALLAGGVAALPAVAKEPVGPPINILVGPPTTFPAGTPLHIKHGWGLDGSMDAVGKLGFALEVDGTYVAKTSS
jgi:hypothetical protein